jgi:UDP-glucose 4-epimerase
MGLKVFVTGASGYLGGVITTHLAKMPEIESITGTFNSTTPGPPASPKIRFIKMEIRSPDLATIMAGHEIVIHSASVIFWKARMPARVRDDINFNGTRNVANAAVKNQVQRFIHASSVAVYDPDLARGKHDLSEDFPIGKGVSRLYYPNCKAMSERMLTEILDPAGITLTFLRPTYVTGPNDRQDLKGFRDNPVIFTNCDPLLQFVHEDDVAKAFVQAVKGEMPGAYNVVPDDCICVSKFTRLHTAKWVPIAPVWLVRLITHIRWRYFGSSIHPSWIDSMAIDTTWSNAKLKATGWQPDYDCAAAIRSAL